MIKHRSRSRALQTLPLPAGMLPGMTGVAMLTALLGWALQLQAGWPARHVLAGLAVYAIVGAVVAAASIRHLTAVRFGLANQVTLLRAGLVCLVGGVLLASGGVPTLGWSLILLVVVALGLDALDGFVARRFGVASRFGARFDLEVDALLLLILAVLVWLAGKVGVWVVAIGLVRYLFVLAGRCWPPLRRPLPPSGRRKTVCALQGIALLGCLLPPVTPALAALIAAAALTALLVSFALDIRWLLRRPRGLEPHVPVGIFEGGGAAGARR